MAADRTSRGLATIRIFLGVFFVFEGLDKLAWFGDAGLLTQRLSQWAGSATAMNQWYLERVALPYAAVFARLVPFGELAAGVALVLGLYTRLAAALAFFMVLNFHVASGALFQYRFLTNGYGLPVLGPLLGLAIGGGRLPWSVRR